MKNLLNPALNLRLTALLGVKLKTADQETQRRRSIANRYLNNITNPRIVLPAVKTQEAHVWHLFVKRTNDREALQGYLTNNGIQTLIYYPRPRHKQQAYTEWNRLSLPVCEKIHKEVLSVPPSLLMLFDEADKVIELLNAC